MHERMTQREYILRDILDNPAVKEKDLSQKTLNCVYCYADLSISVDDKFGNNVIITKVKWRVICFRRPQEVWCLRELLSISGQFLHVYVFHIHSTNVNLER